MDDKELTVGEGEAIMDYVFRSAIGLMIVLDLKGKAYRRFRRRLTEAGPFVLGNRPAGYVLRRSDMARIVRNIFRACIRAMDESL